MIEVTDEMRKAAMEMSAKASRDSLKGVTNPFDELIKRIIKLHEANKPKPEPVGFISFKHNGWLVKPHEAERMKNIDAEFQPLYTAPPTREPLSDEELSNLYLIVYKEAETYYKFARLIEQAHGIGV